MVGRILNGGEAAALYKAALIFNPLWFAGAGVNMPIGIFKAGYFFTAEAPIFLVVFGLLALIAFALARFIFQR